MIHFPVKVQTWPQVVATLAALHRAELGVITAAGDAKAAVEILTLRPALRLVVTDPWPDPTGCNYRVVEKGAKARLAGFGRRVRTIRGTAEEAARAMEPASADFIVLQGSLWLPAEIATWLAVLRPGGMFIGTGLDRPEVESVVAAALPGFGVGPAGTWFRVL